MSAATEGSPARAAPALLAMASAQGLELEWEVGLKPNANVQRRDVLNRVRAVLAAHPGPPENADLTSDPFLKSAVHSTRATVRGGAEPWVTASAAAAARRPRTPAGASAAAPRPALAGGSSPRVHVFPLYDEDPTEEFTEGVGAQEEESVAWTQTLLPALSLDGHWESLLFETSVKAKLLSYARSALAFSSAGVDGNLVSCHRLLLLHGPPGTGKTSLCRALAHKLVCRTADQFAQGHLIELNAHSLFSKWFSESGKLVGAVFAKVRELVDDSSAFGAVLVDEVESLAASRAAALNGTEPSDAVRVVNAVLTQLDSLKAFPNVLVLATSNITQALDAAFADRADLSLFIGLPELRARYLILASTTQALASAGVLTDYFAPEAFEGLHALVPSQGLDLPMIQRITAQHGAARAAAVRPEPMEVGEPGGRQSEEDIAGDAAHAAFRLSLMLYMLAQATAGWSGRSLRRLPLLAHAEAGGEGRIAYASFLLAMHSAVHSRNAEQGRFDAAEGLPQSPMATGPPGRP